MRLVLLSLVAAFSACDGGGPSNGSPDIPSSVSSSSSSSVAASHNAGLNCLESGCHGVGIGGGGPEFYVGGTIFKSNGSPNTNATIRLYAHDTSTLVAELHTDTSGNFYTSDVIEELHIPGGPAVAGVDVELEGQSGGVRTMPGLVSDAHCNLCHKSGGNGRLVVD